MPDYGVTDKGFVLKRMDTILEEIHGELTEGFGFNTRLSEPSILNVLVTTFAGQIADLWETAQDSYYAKYPATATGISLDNAVQYGGIRRKPSKHTSYPLHCTGDDGTYVRENTMVATNTKPEIRLFASEGFRITRGSFNSVSIVVAAAQRAAYTIVINGEQYSYSSTDNTETNILGGLKEAITNHEYLTTVRDGALVIEDTVKARRNVLVLSDNLTTKSVTTIANFFTEQYGKVTLPYGIVSKMVNNTPGFESVINALPPVYGCLAETDIELRQSYIAKSALRSNTMIDSIVSELLHNVEDVESASGYENPTDIVDKRGLPPHSVEIIVEGGNESDIAAAILRKKAGGIWTHGKIEVSVPTNYGDSVMIHFNRPEKLYTWLKVVLHGDGDRVPANYAALATGSIIKDGAAMVAGTSLLVQLLHEGIYDAIGGITRIDILSAYSDSYSYVPAADEYQDQNIMVSARQKVEIDEKRIEVVLIVDN